MRINGKKHGECQGGSRGIEVSGQILESGALRIFSYIFGLGYLFFNWILQRGFCNASQGEQRIENAEFSNVARS